MALCEKIVFGQRLSDYMYFILVFIIFLICVLKNSNAYDKVKGTFHGKEIIFTEKCM